MPQRYNKNYAWEMCSGQLPAQFLYRNRYNVVIEQHKTDDDMQPGRPYTETELVRFLNKRILELRPHKTQAEIAHAAGFITANSLAMIKRGSTKLPIDRVPALAAALEVDAAYLLRLTLAQSDMAGAVYSEIFGKIVTQNEMGWIEELRASSENTDPRITSKGRAAIRGVFGK